MATYQELKSQGEALLKQAEQMKREEAAAAVTEIKEKMALYGLTIADLKGKTASSSTAFSRKRRTDAGAPLPAKYKDSQGNAWSGRGIKPKWLQAALAKGKRLEDFAVA